MRVLILALVIALAFSAPAAAQFEWPQTNPQAIPDARLAQDVQTARDGAREGAQRAREGQVAAGQARRLVAVRSAVGRGPQPTTVADGVVIAAVEYEGLLKGTLTWESSAVLIGNISAHVGVFTPEPESALSSFQGWVFYGTPMTGIFEFRNGDEFRGHYNTGRHASGIYTEAGGERRFVGVIDFETGGYRPLRGYIEDRRGRLLAVVNVSPY